MRGANKGWKARQAKVFLPVLCEYIWKGQTYTVRSGFFWRKPSEYDQHPVAYLDPERPKWAFLDPDSIRLTV